MFGWMAITAASESREVIEAIVPTVAIPLLLATAIASSLVSAVAAWFGIEWKADGAKNLLRKLVTRKALAWIAASTALISGSVAGYRWIDHHSRPLQLVAYMNSGASRASLLVYPNASLPASHSAGESGSGEPAAAANSPEAPSIELAWETKIPKAAFRGLTLSGTTGFASSLDGRVYELDLASGDIRRSFWIGHPAVPLPVVHNGTLFTGEGEHLTHHARVHAFDLATGALKGSVATKGHVEGDLVTHDFDGRTLLFVPAGKDGLRAVDASNLEVVWFAPITHFDSGVSVDGTTVFAATGVEKGIESERPALYALDLATGKQLWKIELAASGWSRPVFVNGWVCVSLGEIYSKRKFGQFACFDKITGENRAAFNFTAPLFGQPLVDRARTASVLVNDFDGSVCRIDVALAKIGWCTRTPNEGRNFSTLAQDTRGRVLATTRDGLRVLNGETGETIFDWKPESQRTAWKKGYAGATIKDGVVYLADGNGVIRKLRYDN